MSGGLSEDTTPPGGRFVGGGDISRKEGDVVIQKQHVDGNENPQMVARFTINAVPALAVLERGRSMDRDGAPVSVWDSIHASQNPGAATTAGPAEAIVPLIYDRRAATRKAAKKRDGAA